MKNIKEFGLIGKNISYSFSKIFFENKFKLLGLQNHSYNFFDIDKIYKVEEIFNLPNLKGVNVTIPYKQLIIPYLDDLSEEAREIGAVNCIAIRNGKKIGYNTDAFGFEQSLLTNPLSLNQSAIILGDGGAAQAVKYVLKKLKIPYITISRKSKINFENIDNDVVSQHKIIIQCTPVGTFPNIEESVPFPFEAITKEHFIIDLIYNPSETKFLKECKKRGAKTMNGLLMLEQQAEKAWKIWNLV